jgi:hypothetical protein
MSKFSLTLWVIGGVLVLALLAYFLLPGGTQESGPTEQSLPFVGSTAPGTFTPAAKVTLEALLGASSTVRLGESDYIIAQTNDDPSGQQEYQILYHAPDRTFTLSLMSEPIGRIRLDAEDELLALLGITETEACALRVNVTVPISVNERYSGKNLGMSFCRGATKLPE